MVIECDGTFPDATWATGGTDCVNRDDAAFNEIHVLGRSCVTRRFATTSEAHSKLGAGGPPHYLPSTGRITNGGIGCWALSKLSVRDR